MRKLWGSTATAAVTVMLVSSSADAQVGQVVTGPVATYWVTAETVSGMGAMAAPGRGTAGIIGAMMGSRASNAAVRNLQLQLGSSRKATGEPVAEHLPPAGLKAGPSLPLVTPRVERASGSTGGNWSGQIERPKGRMLIYWGCGEQARPGQPVVIDFAKLADGQMPQMLTGVNVKGMTPPSVDRHPSYGEWPNQRSRASVPADGSLVGEHVIRGNYTPDIRFTVTSANDFLAPIAPATNALPSGAVRLTWRSVANAKAYLAGVMGATPDNTMVMWSSSERQLPGMSLPDFMAQDDIARLVQQKVLLAPQATDCAVPAEVAKAVGGAMLQMTAFGPEANFVHPPRPANPKQPWNIEWATKVRAKSVHMGMLGPDMPGMAAADDGASGGNAASEAAAPPKKKRSLLKGLSDVVKKELGN